MTEARRFRQRYKNDPMRTIPRTKWEVREIERIENESWARLRLRGRLLRFKEEKAFTKVFVNAVLKIDIEEYSHPAIRRMLQKMKEELRENGKLQVHKKSSSENS